MPISNHAPLLNGACREINPLSFIAGDFLSPHTGRVIEQLAQRIRDRIEALDISQTEVAAASGISVQRLNNYISARRMPDLPTLVKLASALQTTTDYLLGADDTRSETALEILAELLRASGLPDAQVQVIADAVPEAMRLLAVLPDEGEAAMRSRMAARAAWHSRPAPKPH